jgi:ankyrin repeat protein
MASTGESDPRDVSDSVPTSHAAKLIQFVLENDDAGLSILLKSLGQPDHSSSKKPKYNLGDILNAPDDGGWRPLHHAFHLRRYQCAKLLIEAGERRSCSAG